MLYYSLNHQSPKVGFEEAAIKGQAPDKGLYFPEKIPQLPEGFIKNIKDYSKEAIGYQVMHPYIGEAIPKDELHKIIEETVYFPFPLVKITPHISSLELFHGPTLAFKDVGALFMSRCLGYFNRNKRNHVTILVATSGDTGGAVASGFFGVEGVEVVILYPSGKVSPVQELQLTTLGHNIKAIELNGSFDDCQAIVKKAFADTELNAALTLSSANSINIARWLPQQLYYFFAQLQWNETTPPVISVPSGNFGNICAGLLAHLSGLPASHFIAACNENDVVPKYMETGIYEPKPAVPTLSNAMDVGNPSNFVRVLELFQNQFGLLQQSFSSKSISDTQTMPIIAELFAQTGYVSDPHGALAYRALKEYLLEHPGLSGYFLETAHPIKFPETVEKAILNKIEVPESLAPLLTKQKTSVLMDNDFEMVKEWLLKSV